jgi:hypothetical protein
MHHIIFREKKGDQMERLNSAAKELASHASSLASSHLISCTYCRLIGA